MHHTGAGSDAENKPRGLTTQMNGVRKSTYVNSKVLIDNSASLCLGPIHHSAPPQDQKDAHITSADAGKCHTSSSEALEETLTDLTSLALGERPVRRERKIFFFIRGVCGCDAGISVTPHAVHLSSHNTRGRQKVYLFQAEIFEYFRHMSLICLCRDSTSLPLDDAIQDSSSFLETSSSPTTCLCISHFRAIILTRHFYCL